MRSTIAKTLGLHFIIVLFALGLAYLIDIAVLALEDHASSTFQFLPRILVGLLVPLLTSFLMLYLAWYLFRSDSFRQPSSLVYLILGAIGIVIFTSNFVPFPIWLRSTVIGKIQSTSSRVGFDSIFYWVSCYLLVLGVIGKIRARK